jgi:hypothetical protein
MTGPVLTGELVRNADACIGLVALLFVLFDSLSKKADVVTLKERLQLRQSQLLGKVIDNITIAIAPLLERSEDYDFESDYITPPAPAFGETVRNSLTEAIRNSESQLAQLREIGKLPKTIHALNATVFWLIAGVAITEFSCAGILLAFEVSLVARCFLLGIPASVVIAALIVVAIRETKEQYAKGQILNSDPQA